MKHLIRVKLLQVRVAGGTDTLTKRWHVSHKAEGIEGFTQCDTPYRPTTFTDMVGFTTVEKAYRLTYPDAVIQEVAA